MYCLELWIREKGTYCEEFLDVFNKLFGYGHEIWGVFSKYYSVYVRWQDSKFLLMPCGYMLHEVDGQEMFGKISNVMAFAKI